MSKNHSLRSFWVIIILIISSTLLIGCSDLKQLKPADNSLTSENSATLVYRNYFKVKEFNNSKTNSFKVRMAKSGLILIPAGRNTLKIDYNDVKGIPLVFTWGVKAKGMVSTFDFQPGKTYILVSTQYGNFIGPFFSGKKMAVNIEEFSGDFKEYLKNGYRKREKM